MKGHTWAQLCAGPRPQGAWGVPDRKGESGWSLVGPNTADPQGRSCRARDTGKQGGFCSQCKLQPRAGEPCAAVWVGPANTQARGPVPCARSSLHQGPLQATPALSPARPVCLGPPSLTAPVL